VNEKGRESKEGNWYVVLKVRIYAIGEKIK
jgi:hypothetical protein